MADAIDPSIVMRSQNYDGATRGAQVTGVAVCSLCLTWISFTLRIYVRLGILKFVGREDWLTVAAMTIFTIFCSLCLRATVYGLGAHMKAVTQESLETGTRIVFMCELLYVVTTTVTKVAIAAYFLRLSSKLYQRLTVYITLATVMIFSTMYFFFLIFQCGPISYLWEKYNEDAHGYCLSSDTLSAVTYIHSAMSTITDWAFGILPISFVWNMQMDPRTKFSVILILCLGFFASTATIVRIYYIARLTETSDLSWEGIHLAKWSMVEPAIAITAMNIATLRPLFTRNLFQFASKRFDRSTDVAKDTLRPPDLGTDYNRDNSISGKDFSVEFAALLGLSRVGVTTEIYAGSAPPSESEKWRNKWKRRGEIDHQLMERVNESQTELQLLSAEDAAGPSHRELSRGAINWDEGIKTTTVITSRVQ
ncbi:uncharacterized protein L3040_000810 [Drepanopeziza brunnea f. sp. 'multigermtubi']|uniref:uncharacterized protein n=1 Tax=Drepanopeziza brunnea f. sp. 'multigermtubi' TaxID=698441 RepID=UPI002399B795|nr:hypothetical protein L3040_000810 [Drepanopeziza brunnea f. sp. 'multigermtubi']